MQNLSLNEALNEAIKSSIAIKNLNLDERQINLNFKQQAALLFLPEVYLEGSTGVWQNFHKLKKNEEDFEENPYAKSRSSRVGITIEDWNLLNSGRDYLNYKILKIDQIRQKYVLNNDKRSLLFAVYREYFSLKAVKERLNAAKTQVLLIKSFLEVVESKKQKKSQDLFLVKSELSQSINLRNSLNRAYKFQLYAFNMLLNKPLNTDYKLPTLFPKFKNLKKPNLSFVLNNAIELKSLNDDIKIAKLDKDLVNRNIQPYINLNVSGATHGRQWDNDGVETELFESSSTGANYLDYRASIGIRIPLWDSSGVAASYSRESANIRIQRLKNTRIQLKQRLYNDILNKYLALKFIKQDLQNLDEIISNQSKSLDLVMNQYKARKASNLEVRNAITQLTQSIFDTYDKRLEQIDTLISIAKVFPIKNEITKIIDSLIEKKK